jgi:hypothetical protein
MTVPSLEFERAFRGLFHGVLPWRKLDELWQRIDPAAGWYLYAVGEPPPTQPSTAREVEAFVKAVDELLRKEHRESYCGIVYADDLHRPTFVKIFDPSHLGVACGSSQNPPLPGWIMSLIPPCDLKRRGPLPESRRRWWRALFSHE